MPSSERAGYQRHFCYHVRTYTFVVAALLIGVLGMVDT
jgi:hypothetical protein